MICPSCNARISDDSQFCPLCGTHIPEQKHRKEKSTPCPFCGAENKNPVRLIFISVSILILLIVSGMAVYLWPSASDERKAASTDTKSETSNEFSESKKEEEDARDQHKALQEKLISYIQQNGVNDSVSVYYVDVTDKELPVYFKE